MKKLFVIVFVVLIAVSACSQQRNAQTAESANQVESAPQRSVQQAGGAQQRGGMMGGTAEERTNRLRELVSLTDAQVVQIRAIEVELQQRMDRVRENMQGDTGAMRTAMQEIETTREERYRAVLTETQFQRFVADRNERRERQGQGGGGRRPN